MKHGYGVRSGRLGTYNSWAQMRSRCNNPNVPEYKHYGARGIKVCARWDSFRAFLEDMGPRPEGHSIDRIDGDGAYCPENCKWSDRWEQSRNSRRNVQVSINGKTMVLCDWISALGVNKSTVMVRIHRGWPIKRALGLSETDVCLVTRNGTQTGD